jgi:hypothetical protein
VNRFPVVLLLAALPAAAEPGVTLLLDGRQSTQRQLSAQAKRFLTLLRQANQLEDFQLNISTADWSDPSVAALWQRQYGLSPRELPALAVVRRQGNRFSVENLLRHYQSPRKAAEGAFRCLQTNSPNLIRQAELHTGVALTSQPAGALLTVDGQPSGTTPCQLELTPGSHHLVVTQPNFQPFEKRISLELGQTFSQDINLQPMGAFLRVESGTLPVQFSLDGGAAAPTPCLLDVSAGRHHYVASASGYYSSEGDLDIPAERLTSLNIGLVPVRLRVAVANFEALGYTGSNTRSSGTGWRRTEWVEPYEVFLDPAPLKQKLTQGLNHPSYDLVNSDPDCVISVEIRSSQDQVMGTLSMADGQGRVRETLSSTRDMPFMTFDEQGSAQLRAGEVIDELLRQIGSGLQKFSPQTERAPSDRQAQVKVEVGPPP